MAAAESTGEGARITVEQEEQLRAIASRWGLLRLALFGSILRADFSPASDVDVLVQPGPGTPRGFKPRLQLQDELAALFNRPVDLVYEEGLLNPYRRGEILSTARWIYAA